MRTILATEKKRVSSNFAFEGEKVKLSDVCDKASSGYAQKDLEGCEGEYPVYGASGYIKSINVYHQEKEYVAVVKDGAGIGRAMFLPARSSVIGTMQYLLPKQNIWPKYLYYAVKNMHLERYYSGATIPHIYFKDYQKEEFNLPEMGIQKKVVEVLETIEKLINRRNNQLEELDILIKARFLEIFADPLYNEKDWPCVVLTDVCRSIFGGGTPSKSHPEYFTGTIPWVSPKDMKSSIISDSIDHITEEAIKHSTTNLVPANSVLMVIRSGILKHTLPVAINSVPVTINQDMKAFVPNEKVTSSFLMNFFKAIETDVLAGVRGVTADNIDFKTFQQRKIIIPPMELQEQFAAFVRQVDKSKIISFKNNSPLSCGKSTNPRFY